VVIEAARAKAYAGHDLLQSQELRWVQVPRDANFGLRWVLDELQDQVGQMLKLAVELLDQSQSACCRAISFINA
jgi:hypothetical protein